MSNTPKSLAAELVSEPATAEQVQAFDRFIGQFPHTTLALTAAADWYRMSGDERAAELFDAFARIFADHEATTL